MVMFVFRFTPALLIQFRISHLVFDDLVKSLKMRFPVLLPFRKETRGERDRLAENGGSPHPAKEEPPPFLARRMPFCPGRGLICPTGNPLSSEPIENRAFSERTRLFFSTKWEMILNSLDSGFHRSDDFLRSHHFWVPEFL